MALRPVVSLAGGAVVLSLDVVLDLVVGWDVKNTLPTPVRAQLTSGAFDLRQTLNPGAISGLVAAALQWNAVTGSASYGLSSGG